MIARSQYGNDLVEFVPPHDPLDPAIPVTFTIVVAEYDGRTLLIFNNDRMQWEAPGGGVEPGESLDDCVKRELMEEACQVADTLAFKAYARIRLNTRNGREEYGGLYAATLSRVLPFTASEECDRMMLWDGQAPLDAELSVWSREYIKYCR